MVDFIADEERVNVFTEGNQQSLHMAALSGGGYVSVWQSTGQNGSGLGLTAQLYNDVGERVGLPFFIEETTTSSQTIGGVTGTADGGFVVTWEGPFTAEIYARQFDANGAPVTGEFIVNSETWSTQNQPEVTGLTGGGYVVTWSSRNDETFTHDIRAQRYDENGVAQGGEFTVNSTTASNQDQPEIAALNTGGFVVIWLEQGGADGSSTGVYGQRYDAAGVAQGGEFLVNTSTDGQQTEQDVVALTGGGFVVIWSDYNGLDGSAGGVYAQIYADDGTTVGGQFLVNEITNSWQWEPAVTATSDGGFFVSWYSYVTPNGFTYDIVGRHFDATGNALTGDIIINNDGSNTDTRRPDVIGLSNGAIVVGWDYPAAAGDGDGRGVYQRVLQLDGSDLGRTDETILEAFDPANSFTEAELQSGPQILDASGAVAVSGPANFEGGKLTISRITAQNDEILYNVSSGQDQDVLGLRDQGTGAGEVGVSGTSVTFGGVVIGEITSDGANGAPFVVTFNANADAQAVEAVAENLTYANDSDDPIETVELAILLEDGDGGTSEVSRVTVTVEPEVDAPQPVFDTDFRVNSYTNSTQQRADVAALTDGGWVVMWESFGQDNQAANTYGIIGQRYDAAGAPVGGEFLVNTQDLGSQQQVSVTGIDGGPNAGGFVATWYDPAASAQGYIRAQLFGADGQPIGGEIAVPATINSTQTQPSIAGLSDGSFVISWASREASDNNFDIKVQKFDANGVATGAEFIANTDTESTQQNPEITALSGGGYAIAWETYDVGGTNTYEIAARAFASDGTALSGEVAVNTSVSGGQALPDVVGLSGGNYVVVWEDQAGLDGNSYGIYGQMLMQDGTPVGGQFLVNENTQGQQGEPTVAALADGGFAVTYYTSATVFNGSYNIAIQHYDANGNRVDGEIKVNQFDSSSQYYQSIATLANGDTVIVYDDASGADGSGLGILMQIVGDAANYAAAEDNPVVSIAQTSVTFDEADVNAGPQILFAGVDVSDANNADFDGGVLNVFRAGATLIENLFGSPDDETQDNLGLRDQGTAAGEIGLSGTNVTFGGVVIGTLTSDGADGQPLTIALNADATPAAVEALLQNVTYANPSDDPTESRDFRVVLTDGDGGLSVPINVTVQIEEQPDGLVALSSETQVNSYEESVQDSADVGALASGGYVSVWRSYDQDAGSFDYGIFGQRFDASGQAVGDEFQINSEIAGTQDQPKVTGLSAADGGGYVVVWQDSSNTDGYIKAQIHNDDGSVRVPEFMVETEVFSTTTEPNVTVLPSGFLVTWTAYTSSVTPNGTVNTYDIRGQYYDGTGATSGSEFTINANTVGSQRRSDVAADSSGNVVVVWEDQSAQDGSSYGVYARLIDNTGTPVGSDILVNTATTGGQYLAQVDFLTDGRFVVAWYDDSGLDGSGVAVFAQIFDANGSPIGEQFLVNEMVSSSQIVGDVLGLSDGGFAIAYSDTSGTDGSGTGVFMQQYNADGSRRDGAVKVNDEITSTQNQVRLVEITDGTDIGVAAVWTSANSAPAGDGNSSGVFTRVFGEEGTLQPSNFAPEVENLAQSVGFDVATIGTAQLLDGALELTDPDSADFDGGTVELRYNDYRTTADDQLSILDGKGITVSGSDVSFGGTVIGVIDATDDGVNGADLVVNLNANATAANVRFLMEQLAFASTNPTVGVDRSVSVRVSDGDGGLSEGDSIRIEIENSVAAPNIALNDVDNRFATESEVEAGILLDQAVDFVGEGNSYDGGFAVIGYRTAEASRSGAPYETLNVANNGTGGNEISVSGSDVSYEGTVIGTIDAVLNGVAGSDLQINLNADATDNAVDALIEAFTYSNVSDGPAEEVRFDIRVTDALGETTGDRNFDLSITPEVDGATVALGGEMQVNAFIDGEQSNSAIAELSDGGFVVTWQSYNQDSATGFTYGVYQQRYTEAGEPVGPETVVNQVVAGSQNTPDIAGFASGGWVTVWQSPDGSSTGVWARVFDANGNPAGDEFLVNEQISSSQQIASVTTLANGNFVVSWAAQTSAGSGDGSSEGIAGRIFDASGTPITGDFIINSVTASTQRDVDIESLDGGGFVAVWESSNSDGDSFGVAFQRFAADGTPQGTETNVNTTVAGSQDDAKVGSLSDGGFVVVWQGPDLNGDGVFMQRFDANGVAVGGEERVNDAPSGSQSLPDVTGTTDGGWVVTFSDSNSLDGSGGSVQAQRYDAAGARIDGNFTVNDEFSSTQTAGVAATLSDGRVVVSWQSNTSNTAGDGSGTGIFVRLFGEDSQSQSDDPSVGGIEDVTVSEADLNAGPVQLFGATAVSVSDLDSADFDGGRLMVHALRNFAAAEQFNAPDNLEQDVLSFEGADISISGIDVSVGGVIIGTLEQDGQSGTGLQVLLNANATAETVETLLGGLNYANPSNDPRDTREIEVTLTDGDGGVSDYQTFTVNITEERDGLERIGDEVQVNSYTLDTQTESDVAGLLGGGHVVVWASYAQDNPGQFDYGIFAQRFDVDGQPIGPEFQVNTTFAGQQDSPSVVALSNGNFVVAWDGNGIGDSNNSFAQLFAADGTPIGTEFRLDDDIAGSDLSPTLAASPDGGFMAVWYSSTGTEVQGRLYDNLGTAQGAAFTINSNPASTQSQGEVGALSGGGYAVVWLDSATGEVMVRVLDASGGFVTDEMAVSAPDGFNDEFPSVAGLTGGGFVVSWTITGGSDGSGDGVYAQLYSAAGVAQGDAFLVNETVSSTQDDSHVVGLPTGGFVIVYRDGAGVDGNGQGVLAQQFDANGNRVDGQIVVNTEISSSQTTPAVDVLENGGIVVTWNSNTSGSAGDGSGSGIFSQIFGDPADFNIEGRPELQGLNESVTFLENALNIGPQVLDANTAVAVSDIDSANFDGGFLRVDNVISSRGYQDQVAAPDNFTQDNLGLRQAEGITINGNDVFVNGTQVGTILSNGVAGNPFEISLNAAATLDVVELLVENLTYRNTSDDPDASRVIRVQLGDGDGGLTDPQLVTVNITAEIDGATPVFGERQANTETDGEQSNSAIATLDDGGFVIVWQSYNQDSGVNTYAVMGQRFDSNGNAVDGEFQVNTTEASNQYTPEVSSLNNGGFVVTWRDDGGVDGSGTAVLMQRYDADGTTSGGETQVNTYANSTQYNSSVTVLENGDFVVTYASFNNTGAGGSFYDVFAQVYTEDGTPIGSEFLVNSEINSNQDWPDVSAIDGGGFAITWQSDTSGTSGDGDSRGVFYQVYGDSSANYAAVGGELQANGYIASSQDQPAIVGLVGGGHVIVWESSGQDGWGEGIFAQQYDSAGVAIGQEFRVNDQRIGTQSEPDVAALSTGGYVIVFSDSNSTDGSGWGVFAQQYDANGNRVDNAVQVNTEFLSTQNDPSVSALENGGFVVSWSSSTNGTAGDGSSTGVFYQVFSNSAPVVTDVAATTDEDVNLVFSSDIFADGYADAEGQALAEVRIDVLPSVGSLEFNGSPVAPGQVITVAELDAGALVFIPPADFNGTADFGWTGSDGSSFAADIALTNITVTPVNDEVGLSAVPDQTISEGTSLNIQLLLADPDNDTYTVTVDYGEGDGDTSYNTTSKTPGLFNFYEAEGTYTVNVSVNDNNGSVETASFDVTVENGAPFADNEFFATDEDTSVTSNVFVGDSDPGGDPFTVTAIDGVAYTAGDVITLPSGATLSISATGDMVYDPSTSNSLQSLADGENDSDSFTYTITDDAGLSDTATVNFNVSGADDNVDARDDTFFIDEDSELTGSVLADNGDGPDVDPEGDNLTIVSVNGSDTLVGSPFVLSGGGVLQVDANGDISFDAAGQYDELNVGDTRDVSFTYVVEEDGSNLTASATGTITITGENDDPTAQNDGYNAEFETALNVNVLANDFDVDSGDTFSVTDVGDPSNGMAVIELDGTVTYTPNDGFSGTDSFTYEITDANGGTSTATVTVNVNGSAGPDAQDDAVQTDEDSTASGNLFADNGNGVDSDPEGDDFTITAVNGQSANVGSQITLASGALLLVGADGSYTYDPNDQFEGTAEGAQVTDSFSYTITDENGGTDTAFVTVSIDGVNDAPTVQNGAMNAAEDGTPVNLNLATLGDDIDNDDTGASLDYAVTTDPSDGAASITGNQLNFDPEDGFQELSEGETLDVVIGVTATDSNGASSDEADVTVTVLGTNDDPTLGAGIMAATEDGAAVTLDLATLGDDIDSEDDGSSLTYTVVGDPSEGSADVNGTELSFDPGADFQDLNEGETRDVTITVEAEDARGATVTNDVTVTVTGVNDDPTLAAGVGAATEDGAAISVDLSALGDDIDNEDNGETLTYAVVGDPSEGTAEVDGLDLNFDPGSDFQDLSEGDTRDVTITVEATDAQGATTTNDVTITVTGVNDDPTLGAGTMAATEDGAAVTLDLATLGDDIDSEDDGSSLSYAVVGDPAEGSADIEGTDLSFDPGADFQDLAAGATRDVTITVEATDAQGATVTNDVTVTITGVNDDPTANNDATSTGFNSGVVINVLENDTDVDVGDALSITDVGDPDNGSVELNENGTITYTPDEGFGGVDTFTYDISDGQGGTSTATVTVTVTSNSPPVATDDFFDTDEDTAVSGNVVLDNNGSGSDFDPDGDQFSLTAINGADQLGSEITLASGATVTLNTDGSFDYDPNGAFEYLSFGDVDTDGFTYTLTDINGLTATGNVEIDIAGVNDDPTLAAATMAASEDGAAVMLDLSGLGDDPDGEDNGETLTYTIVGDPSEGTADIDGLDLSFDPGADFQDLNEGETRDVTITVEAEDAQGATVTNDVTVTVTGVNDDPTLASATVFATEDGAAVSIDLATLGDDADGEDDGASLSYAIIGDLPAEGTVTLIDGELGFDPGAGFQDLGTGETRSVTVDIQATDARDAVSSVETVTFTVTGVNDAPTLDPAGPFNVDENTTAVGTMTASDIDSDAVMFDIIGGADGGLFSIDEDTGALSFSAAPDFEAPGDVGGDNTYEVEVSVSDGEESASQLITVNVQDVDDTGPVLNTITGTEGRDVLIGTAGDDYFIFNGGRGDVGVGRGGSDTFDLAANLGNGGRDYTRISDWGDDDTLVGIDITDVNLATVRSTDSYLRFSYGPDNDTLLVTGDVEDGLGALFDLGVA